MAPSKVVHLTSVHDHDDPRIFRKECRTLAAAGYEVVLIAPHDRTTTIDGVTVKAVPRPRRRWQRMTITLWQVYRAALRERAEIYHFHDPELILVGLLLKLHSKRVIYDAHEDLPLQIMSKHWIPRPLRRTAAWAARVVESIAHRVLDGVVAATPPIGRRFLGPGSITVQNFPISVPRFQRERPAYGQRDPVVAYVGGISKIRGAREMVQAIDLLPSSLGARLVLAGQMMPPELEEELKAMPGWARTDYVGWQSQAGVRTLLDRARVGLALLHPAPNYVECYSTKLFEYMQAGIPVVASHFPLWQEIIGSAGAGLLVDPFDPGAVARVVRYLLEHPAEAEAMGRCGQRAVQERYTWERQAVNLLSFYHQLSGTARSLSP